jgi:hypothetical protein
MDFFSISFLPSLLLHLFSPTPSLSLSFFHYLFLSLNFLFPLFLIGFPLSPASFGERGVMARKKNKERERKRKKEKENERK